MMAAALAGAVFPDLDLIFFYFVDNRAFHHHAYWVHAPAFAAACSALAWGLARLLARPAAPVVLAFAAAWMLHIVLDSLAGGIMWLWPLDTRLFQLVEVPATRSHWLASFLNHWTFLPEVAICVVALLVYRRSRT